MARPTPAKAYHSCGDCILGHRALAAVWNRTDAASAHCTPHPRAGTQAPAYLPMVGAGLGHAEAARDARRVPGERLLLGAVPADHPRRPLHVMLATHRLIVAHVAREDPPAAREPASAPRSYPHIHIQWPTRPYANGDTAKANNRRPRRSSK
jgi:hypothetical protein